VYDLQDSSMESSLWKMHCEEAATFINSNLNTPFVGDTVADKLFADKWEKIKIFRKFELMDDASIKKTTLKVPKAVLTRWWTVGEAASVTWSAYILIFRVCQQVINAQATIAKSNKIASQLQPLLLEEELFADLAMIHNYHCFFVTPHFGWMQAELDLSNVAGFQSHNSLLKYTTS
jgi:hypothetical protein